MRTLHVVTHAEATHHVENLVGGWYDSALTQRGLAQAERIADALVDRVPTGSEVEVFSSDLRRARQTAEPTAARFAVGVMADAALRERSYGDAEGRPPGSLAVVAPPETGDRMHHRDGVHGSETRWDVATRIYAGIDRVLARDAQNHVVVTHGGAATFLIAAWIQMPIAATGHVHFRVSPGSITVLQENGLSGSRQVVTLNDTRHLDGC